MIVTVVIGDVTVEVNDEVKRPSLDAIESVLSRAVQSAVDAYYATWDDPDDDDDDDGGTSITFTSFDDDEDEDTEATTDGV